MLAPGKGPFASLTVPVSVDVVICAFTAVIEPTKRITGLQS